MSLRHTIITGFALLCATTLQAQQRLFINQTDRYQWGVPLTKVDSVTYNAATSSADIFLQGAAAQQVSLAKLVGFTVGEPNGVRITYDASGVTVINPYATEGVAVAINGADVTVTSTTADEIDYYLSGTTADGCFKIYSDKKLNLHLNGVNITNNDGPAINIQSKKKITVTLEAGTTNTLLDGASYTKVSGEDQKATLFSEGQLIFKGTGSLSVKGLNKHGICSDDYIDIRSGQITVTGAASDAIHANDSLLMSGGTVNLTATSDGMDIEGYIHISGGDLTMTLPSADIKGLKCDSTLNISGGNIKMYVSGAQSKAYKSKQDIRISGGTHYFETSGDAVLVNYDPSYCTAIKSDGRTYITGGNIQIISTGIAGKGISSDGNLYISDATINIKASGKGVTYTTSSNVKDSYQATCITGDSLISIYSGMLTLSTSGSAAKCISADGKLLLGGGNPTITASTTGAKLLVSGSGNNADYANPKVIKGESDVTVTDGTYTLTASQDGGEGLESKATLTINGGTFDINTYDDCINAAKAIVINGGMISCYASGNDGIDSNGTLTITGGVVISSGTSSPEEGFDCDNNTFKVTGGILIGTGGATSNPTTSVTTQQCVKYTMSATKDQYISIRDASNNDILTYKLPRTMSSMLVLFSTPTIAQNTTYTIYKGGTVTGGTDFHGYVTGGTYSGGTSAATFTPTSVLTTVGSSSGGGGGRPWGW
jgi:hypothetical protein